MSFITALGVATPPYRFEQSVISSFMERLATNDEQRRKIKTIFRASAIKSRHTVLNDYGKSVDFDFFANTPNLDPFPGTAARMEIYKQQAIKLSLSAIYDLQSTSSFDYSTITHLITVSCTGMYAPGLDIDLIRQLPLSSSINRTCINFMGCFAAINAIKLANAFCKTDAQTKVLIVCTELCSLHFQKDFTDDNILANALFADGSAALLVEGKCSNPILSIENFYSTIAHQGAEDMTWSIGNLGFEMRLSTYVPQVLAGGILSLVEGLQGKLNSTKIDHYAVHPGGKKILDVVADSLKLDRSGLRASYEVLSDYGNMSSPSIVFVLNKMLTQKTIQPHDVIMGMAFGPGLTMESFLLRAL